jgi:predicted RNA-binding protein YlxR (DUF448 family)
MSSPGRVRTCIGCRQRTTKLELVRVVAGERGADLEVVPDPAGRAPGRGAHLHPTPACLALALRRRAFPRALRTEPGRRLDTTAVEAFVAAAPPQRTTQAHQQRTDQEREQQLMSTR